MRSLAKMLIVSSFAHVLFSPSITSAVQSSTPPSSSCSSTTASASSAPPRGGGASVSESLAPSQHHHHRLVDSSTSDNQNEEQEPWRRRGRLTRFFLRFQPTSPELFVTTKPAETPCARLATEFEKVRSNGGGAIDVVRLLHAAQHYTIDMRRIGQAQSANDMERNIAKARALLHHAPRSTHHNLQELLEYEKSTGIHAPRGHIKDPSGAVGLLWIRRSLAYQHRMFDLILNHHQSPPAAALQAYHHELQHYHGWALQRIYTLAMTSMTPATTSELLAKVGGFDPPPSQPSQQQSSTVKTKTPLIITNSMSEDQETTTRKDLQRLLNAWKPLLQQWKQIYHQLDLEDVRRY